VPTYTAKLASVKMQLGQDERLVLKSVGETVEVEVGGKEMEVSTMTLSKTTTKNA